MEELQLLFFFLIRLTSAGILDGKEEGERYSMQQEGARGEKGSRIVVGADSNFYVHTNAIYL